MSSFIFWGSFSHVNFKTRHLKNLNNLQIKEPIHRQKANWAKHFTLQKLMDI